MVEDGQKDEDVKAQKKNEEWSLEEARNVVKELREQNALFKSSLDRAEKFHAEGIISGRASAGAEKIVKEETPQEYASRVVAGTTSS